MLNAHAKRGDFLDRRVMRRRAGEGRKDRSRLVDDNRADKTHSSLNVLARPFTLIFERFDSHAKQRGAPLSHSIRASFLSVSRSAPRAADITRSANADWSGKRAFSFVAHSSSAVTRPVLTRLARIRKLS